MKLWDEFFDYVRPALPGAEEPILEIHIRNAAIEFFKRTGAMRQLGVVLPVTAGVSTYIPSPAARLPLTEITRVNNVVMPNGSKTSMFLLNGQALVFSPAPAVSGMATLDITLRPSIDSVGIDDAFFSEYVTSIANGAISTLAAIPDKPYTNPDTAARAAAQFALDIQARTILVNKGFVNTKLRAHGDRIV